MKILSDCDSREAELVGELLQLVGIEVVVVPEDVVVAGTGRTLDTCIPDPNVQLSADPDPYQDHDKNLVQKLNVTGTERK